MFEDNRIHKNKIVDIYFTGKQKIYRVETSSGCYVDCTLNHSFPTPTGKKKLKELSVGDNLYVKGTYEKTPDTYRFTNGIFESNVQKKEKKVFRLKKMVNVISLKQFIKKILKIIIRVLCAINLLMVLNLNYIHIDHDRTHNDKDNLMWLCNNCHKKIHYKNGRKKLWKKESQQKLKKLYL